MSGGSWDYFYSKCEDAANNLEAEASPLRRAFGAHMQLVAKAMHDIEWVDSCDMGRGDDRKAMQAVLGDAADIREIEVLLSDGRKVIDALEKLGA